VGAVPGDDLLTPPHDGAAELADLGRAVLVLEVVAEAGDELERQVGVVVVVDLADGLFSVNRP
jgi:hypothetical protein